MKIQMLFVLLFALNLLLLWKVSSYRKPGMAMMLLIPLVTPFFPQPRFQLDYFWWQVAGIGLMLLGAGLNIWAAKALKSGQEKWENLGRPVFVTAGPYQYLRQPLLLSLVFVIVGWWWVWAGIYAFYFGMFIVVLVWVQGYLEERLILEKKYGEAYKSYKQTTGMFWIK